MGSELLAGIFTTVDEQSQRVLLNAMPLMLGVLCILAIAYRYYSAFLAAKVAALDDSRVTPAHRFNDGQNYHPTNKWVLFGHHFAAISGAGPLIGPVLAIQYGYAPGLLWLVIGVTLAGAVQDMLVLAASVRHNGKSLAQIARDQIGGAASIVMTLAILFIVIIALAGLGFVVVKALGGETVKLPEGMRIILPENGEVTQVDKPSEEGRLHQFPESCTIQYSPQRPETERPESFQIRFPEGLGLPEAEAGTITLPGGCEQVVPGSSWGTFTIFCTIPIALFVGLWMYRIRPGKVFEASLIGAGAVIGATVAGAWIPGSSLEGFFSLTREETILALCGYGFIAAVLPVWLLLAPRDYLSSFLKLGTLAMLVIAIILANPALAHPPLNDTFLEGGPTFQGNIFPFVFICIMCGAISGFHSLVSSGTTPKMIDRESHIRPIGYGAMLCEGLVGLVALIAAAAMPPTLYYDINVAIDKEAQFQEQLAEMNEDLGITPEAAADPLGLGGRDIHKLDLAEVEEMVGGESLRGRTGGAVTLAVSMATILTDAFSWANANISSLMKYWYHFAIMFEALFILTTIDAGTRIGRFMLQEALGKVYKPFEKTDWWPGAVFCTLAVTVGWGMLIYTGEIGTIWPMFGIANQLLAVVALALVTTWLVNTGRGKYAPITVLPMLFVMSTTLTAGTQMVGWQFPAMIQRGETFKGWLNIVMALFVIISVMTLVLMAVSRWIGVWMGVVPMRKDEGE